MILKVILKDGIQITIDKFEGELEQLGLDMLDDSIPFLFLPKTIVAKDNVAAIFELSYAEEEEEFNHWGYN